MHTSIKRWLYILTVICVSIAGIKTPAVQALNDGATSTPEPALGTETIVPILSTPTPTPASVITSTPRIVLDTPTAVDTSASALVINPLNPLTFQSSTSPVLSMGTYDEDHAGISYTPEWEVRYDPATLDGSHTRTIRFGEKLTFQFYGNQLSVIYTRMRDAGRMRVTIDGVIYKFDTYKRQPAYQVRWTSPVLESAVHNVTIEKQRQDNKAIYVDGLTVYGSPPTVTAMPSSTQPGWNINSPTVAPVTTVPSTPTNLIPTPTALPSATPSYPPSQIPSPTTGITPTQIVPSATPTAIAQATATATTSVPSSGASAATYYVSKTGNNTDGKTWATAWTGLAQVNWSIIQPGATIYISGGTTSTTYSGGIRITKSGGVGGYITIDTGANSPSPAGHNGAVVIEGGDYCVLATGNYLKVRNLLCQHATSSGFRIEGTGSILEKNTVRETYGQGIHVHYCKGCVVRGNRVTTFPSDGPNESRPYQTDGIVIYESSDTLIEGNWVRLTNQYASAHIDGIQASTKLGTMYENITIQYNYVENTKNMTSNSQGIYLTQMEGNIKIIGNVVNHPNGNQTVVSYLANTVGAPANVYVVGNTIKCAGYRCLLVGDNDPVIKNNIIWQTGPNQLVDLRDNTNCNPANINNNLYYAPNSSYPFAGSCGRTWAEWHTNSKLDTNGLFGLNPNIDSCFRPTNASPLIGKGAILTAEYQWSLNSSLCGPNGPDAFLPVLLHNRNPYGTSSWDIGAYEFSGIQ